MIWEWIKNNPGESIVIFIPILSVLVPLLSLLYRKSREQDIKNYERFHTMIGKLSNQGGDIGLDQQIAIIFELRNFPTYRPVIQRILTDSQKRWSNGENTYLRLAKEAEETLKFVNSSPISRLMVRIYGKIWKTVDIPSCLSRKKL